MSVPPETNSFHVQLFSLFSTANQYNYDHMYFITNEQGHCMSYLVHRFSMGYLCPRKLDERKKKKGVLQDLCFLLGITFASSSKRKRVRFLFIFKSKECTGHT